MMERNDRKFGMAIGILLPTVLFLILFFGMVGGETFEAKWEIGKQDYLTTKLSGLCCAVNLAPFYFFLNRELDESARGVINGTLIVGILSFVFTLLF